MAARYRKGANAERELLAKLNSFGFAVVRAAGSGAGVVSVPDIVAIKRGRIIAFECKFWNSNNLSIPEEQFVLLKQWAKKANAELYFAWKIPNRGWFIFPPKEFKKRKNYSITKSRAMSRAYSIDNFLKKLG